MNKIEELKNNYHQNIIRNSQRLLSLLDRDTNSPTYGSFDRDFWHYKIRDFSSMVMQQGHLSLYQLYKWDNKNNIFYKNKKILEWIKGGIKFWITQQLKNGSFNEYYPYEEGFPPTAFSLYSIVLLIKENKNFYIDDLKKYIEKSCQWILNNPENQALNQEAIALSAVYIASTIDNIKINKNLLNNRLEKLLNSQSKEGWFYEYGGADTGYLSVTIDALWDYYRFSNDNRALKAIKKAIDFIKYFIINETVPVMINSRNTDYIVPYGIFNYALVNKDYMNIAIELLKKITQKYNFLDATDDRYIAHYIYTSCVRGLEALETFDITDIGLKINDVYFEEAGIIIKSIKNTIIYINLKKGGVCYVYKDKKLTFFNHGYRYKNGKIAVSNCLDGNESISINYNEILIKQNFILKKFLKSSPLKHIILRVISFLFGKKIIPLLKKILIFSNNKYPIILYRKFIFKNDTLYIEDIIESNVYLDKIYISSPYSLRHVASAFRFTTNELIDYDQYKNFEKSNNKLKINYIIKIDND
jgi:hypothetical protein